MNEINGVQVFLVDHDQRIEVGHDAYLGELTPGKVKLQVVTNRDKDVRVYHVDGQKNIISSRQKGGRTYVTVVPIINEEDKSPFTRYQDNNMRLLELDSVIGKFRTWEIALVSQDGHFFATIQQIYEAQVFQAGNYPVCPFFMDKDHNWPQMVDFVTKIFFDKVDKLSPISEYMPPTQPQISDLANFGNLGFVLWWNCSMGMGVIQTAQGSARVYWSQVERNNALLFLKKNEAVTYEELRDVSNGNGQRKTAFKKEAINVRPIID